MMFKMYKKYYNRDWFLAYLDLIGWMKMYIIFSFRRADIELLL